MSQSRDDTLADIDSRIVDTDRLETHYLETGALKGTDEAESTARSRRSPRSVPTRGRP